MLDFKLTNVILFFPLSSGCVPLERQFVTLSYAAFLLRRYRNSFAYSTLEFIIISLLNMETMFLPALRFTLVPYCSFKINEYFVCVVKKVLKYS
jgi:predicted membrane metal-binding protein